MKKKKERAIVVSIKEKDNRMTAVKIAMQQIEKQFGAGSIMKLGQDQIDKKIDVISTGSISVDMALGVGGFPRGRIVEIYGPEASGKTTLTEPDPAFSAAENALAAAVKPCRLPPTIRSFPA